jgi:alpha-tubulin suppressor-like RCC1 family protein
MLLIHVLENDLVYSMGSNSHGQLGNSDNPTQMTVSSPVLVEELQSKFKIDWVACGGNKSFAVIENG